MDIEQYLRQHKISFILSTPPAHQEYSLKLFRNFMLQCKELTLYNVHLRQQVLKHLTVGVIGCSVKDSTWKANCWVVNRTANWLKNEIKGTFLCSSIYLFVC